MSYVRPGVWGNEWLRFKSQGDDYWMPRSTAPGAPLTAVTDAFVIIPAMYGTLATDNNNTQLITLAVGGQRYYDGWVRCHFRLVFSNWNASFNLPSASFLQAVPDGFRPIEDATFAMPVGTLYNTRLDIFKDGSLTVYRPVGTQNNQQSSYRILEWVA